MTTDYHVNYLVLGAWCYGGNIRPGYQWKGKNGLLMCILHISQLMYLIYHGARVMRNFLNMSDTLNRWLWDKALITSRTLRKYKIK